MYKIIKITVFLLLGLFYCNFLYSQDIIITKSNEKIECSIKEISTDEIKYQTADSDIILGITKDQVMEVIFASGKTMQFESAMKDKMNYEGQKKNALTFKLFSPLWGYSSFSYERSIKPGASIEFSLGIIGLGNQRMYSSEPLWGSTYRVGYKFIKSPDFYLKGIRYSHLLKGLYFKPELAISIYGAGDYNCVASALLFTLGYQWVFNNFLVVDTFFGLGYGLSTEGNLGSHFGFSVGDKSFPGAISSGFRIGILL